MCSGVVVPLWFGICLNERVRPFFTCVFIAVELSNELSELRAQKGRRWRFGGSSHRWRM